MRRNILGFMFVGMLLAAAPAHALVLTVDGGLDGTVAADFDPVGFPGGVSAGDPIKIFNSVTPGGLKLLADAKLKFEYYGKEADFVNFFVDGSDSFSTATSIVGDSFITNTPNGFVPFKFVQQHGGFLEANNNGPIAAGLSIAFADLGNNSFLIMFNDGSPDFDRDDLVVRVSAVPLPAAAWLLLSAIIGLLGISRVSRTGARSTA